VTVLSCPELILFTLQSCFLEIRIQNLKIRVWNLEIRIRNLKIQIRNLKIRIRNLKIRIRNLKIRIRNLKIRIRNLNVLTLNVVAAATISVASRPDLYIIKNVQHIHQIIIPSWYICTMSVTNELKPFYLSLLYIILIEIYVFLHTSH
jgi:hypothetical protein